MKANRPRQTFARRIVLAFTLMTVLVSGVSLLVLAYTEHRLEKALVSQVLKRTLKRVQADVKQGKEPRLDYDALFFADRVPGHEIPEKYALARRGFNEREDAWIYVREDPDGRRYMLVQDQREFEKRERAMLGILLAGSVLTVAGAAFLGKLAARRVISPIIRLEAAVRQLDATHRPESSLAKDYANDEIGSLATAFDAAVARLAGALERERLFTSDVSHELRTPLMIVATSCELLEVAPLAPHEREQVARIARAVEAMRALVETFLVLARAKSEGANGATVTLTADAGLADTARVQAEHWGEAIRAKGLDFEFIREAEDEGRYNAACLTAIIGNLLRNALHYTERGSIRLILEQGGFRVEDSGIGIPETEREKVFEVFARGSAARGEGLGLGLSLVKRVCAHQGWTITLDALPEGGSLFSVKFR